jgi:hypothetical protein
MKKLTNEEAIAAISGVMRVAQHELSDDDFNLFLGQVTLLMENIEEYLEDHKELD